MLKDFRNKLKYTYLLAHSKYCRKVAAQMAEKAKQSYGQAYLMRKRLNYDV